MALIMANVRSQVMDMETQLVLTFPDHEENWDRENTKVVYLLHGLSNNATAWLRGSNIDRYAQERNFITVMPEVQRSMYTDMEYGIAYFTYITKELPEILRKMFGINHTRENTFIAGLSMGGLGAMKCALNCPEQYAGVASLSGAVVLEAVAENMGNMVVENPRIIKEMQAIYGFDFIEKMQPKKEDNLKLLATETDEKDVKPAIYLSCGTEDFLYSANIDMKNHLDTLNYNFRYFEGPGAHTWNFWDEEIQKALDFFLEV